MVHPNPHSRYDAPRRNAVLDAPRPSSILNAGPSRNVGQDDVLRATRSVEEGIPTQSVGTS